MSDPSSVSIERARAALVAIEVRGAVSGRRPKFFYFQLKDAFRLSHMARALVDYGMSSSIFTAEAVEVLVRRVVEQAILSAYFHAESGNEPIDRFLKTSALQFLHSWKEEHQVEDKDMPVAQLPDYRAMASASPELYALYQKLSYLSHPRSALPYSLVESDNQKNRCIDAREFFRRRCKIALAELARCLDIITTIFENEDADYQKKTKPA